MKRILALALLFTSLAIPLAWVRDVDAHVLERDGDISAVLHMPPDDAPAAGEATVINLAFASSGQNFTIINYQVTLDVRRGGRTIQQVTMEQLDKSDSDTTATINLPQAGAYTLAIDGVSKTGGQGFELEYDIRASGRSTDGETRQAGAGFDFWAICLGAWAVLVIVATKRIRSGGRYQR